jgi:O-methyltransferase
VNIFRRTIRRTLNKLGYDIVNPHLGVASADIAITRQVQPFTMTSTARQLAVVDAVRYLVANGIQGDFAECGVWRGGSMMAAALTLRSCGDTSRSLYLFDTFEGMTPPTKHDVSHRGRAAEEMLSATKRREGETIWAFATQDDVRINMGSTQYPAERVHYVAGKVEDTLPARAPEKLAFLRLDTDWYESTKHELEHLYPRLVPNGVLIIDDYGHWEGARRAVDEYFAAAKPRPFLSRLDFTGRLLIKPATS